MIKNARHILMVIMIMLVIITNAQDSTYIDTDTVYQDESSISFPWSFYLEGQYEWVDFGNKDHSSTFYGVGAEYKFITAGFFYNELNFSGEDYLIFPNLFSLKSSSGGFYFGTKLLDKEFFDITTRLSIGRGDILWSRSDSNDDFARDEFNVLKPEILFELEPTMITKFYLGIGYKHISEFDLPHYYNTNLSGLAISLGLKLGFFYHPNE